MDSEKNNQIVKVSKPLKDKKKKGGLDNPFGIKPAKKKPMGGTILEDEEENSGENTPKDTKTIDNRTSEIDQNQVKKGETSTFA